MTCGPSPVGRRKRLVKRDRKCAKMLGMETQHRQLRLIILNLLRKMSRLKVIAIPKHPSFSCPKFSKSENPPGMPPWQPLKVDLEGSKNCETSCCLLLT